MTCRELSRQHLTPPPSLTHSHLRERPPGMQQWSLGYRDAPMHQTCLSGSWRARSCTVIHSLDGGSLWIGTCATPAGWLPNCIRMDTFFPRDEVTRRMRLSTTWVADLCEVPHHAVRGFLRKVCIRHGPVFLSSANRLKCRGRTTSVDTGPR